MLLPRCNSDEPFGVKKNASALHSLGTMTFKYRTSFSFNHVSPIVLPPSHESHQPPHQKKTTARSLTYLLTFILAQQSQSIAHSIHHTMEQPSFDYRFSLDSAMTLTSEALRQERELMEASAAGELTLRTENEGSTVRAFFGKLVPHNEECRDGAREVCLLKVDTKKLVCCLQWQQSAMVPNVSNALLCFIENQMLLVHVTFNPNSLGCLT